MLFRRFPIDLDFAGNFASYLQSEAKHRTYGRLLIVTNVGMQAQPKRADFLRSANSLEGKNLD